MWVLRLTGWHSWDFSCNHAVESKVRQGSSHHATRKSKVLQDKTDCLCFLCTAQLRWRQRVIGSNGERTLGAWSRYCFPLESWVSRQNLLSCRTYVPCGSRGSADYFSSRSINSHFLRRPVGLPGGWFWGCPPACGTPSSRSLCKWTSWCPARPWNSGSHGSAWTQQCFKTHSRDRWEDDFILRETVTSQWALGPPGSPFPRGQTRRQLDPWGVQGDYHNYRAVFWPVSRYSQARELSRVCLICSDRFTYLVVHLPLIAVLVNMRHDLHMEEVKQRLVRHFWRAQSDLSARRGSECSV